MSTADSYEEYEIGSEALVAKLVEDHMGWSASIARSVARAWNMDWQLDGLDGGAYEALLFCAGRYDPQRGIPFRAYARRRIHEASTEEARKSKGWKQGLISHRKTDPAARDISAQLFDVFPTLREGVLPETGEEGIDGMRNSVRQLLSGASLIAAYQESKNNPDVALELKQLIELVSQLEPVHQSIIWAVYWQSQSMRSLADEWQVDELTVIREHKVLLNYINSRLTKGLTAKVKKLKIRPGLRTVAQQLRRKKTPPPFAEVYATLKTVLVILATAVQRLIGICFIFLQHQ